MYSLCVACCCAHLTIKLDAIGGQRQTNQTNESRIENVKRSSHQRCKVDVLVPIYAHYLFTICPSLHKIVKLQTKLSNHNKHGHSLSSLCKIPHLVLTSLLAHSFTLQWIRYGGMVSDGNGSFCEHWTSQFGVWHDRIIGSSVFAPIFSIVRNISVASSL